MLHKCKSYDFFQDDSCSPPCNHPTTSSGICKICHTSDNKIGYGDDDDDVIEDRPKLHIQLPPEEQHFVLELKESRSFRNANAAHEMTYKVKIARNDPDLLFNNLLPNLQAIFDTLLHHTCLQYGDQGIARIYIDHPKLESPIVVRPKHIWELSGTEIMEVIEKVLSSAGNVPADDELDINIAIIKLLKGSGRRSITNIKKDTIAKRCFITIRNDDLLCLPRAIVVGLAHLKHTQDITDVNLRKEYDKIRKKGSQYQTDQAYQLLIRAGIPPTRPGISQDIPLYEDILGLSICLFSCQTGNQ